MFKILAICFLFCVPIVPFAQQNKIGAKIQSGSIIGNVLDNVTGKPLPLASIVLKKLGDSMQMISQITDKNGAFDFEKLGFGYYRLTINMASFSNHRIDSIHISNNTT